MVPFIVPIQTAARFLRRFRDDEAGSIAVESMVILPMLVWAYIGTYTFFDAYRAQLTNVKAAYTISDNLSRQTDFITPQYMDSMFALLGFLTGQTADELSLRVTVYEYDASDDAFYAIWSQARGGGEAVAFLPGQNLEPIEDILPVQAEGTVAIIAETWVDYNPPLSVGINPFTFEDAAMTMPRFAAQLCWNTLNAGGTMATATC